MYYKILLCPITTLITRIFLKANSAIVGASEAMPYGQNWPTRGRLPVYVTFGEPMGAEDGETVVQFSERIAKEVRGLVDYAMTYRASQA